MRVMQALLCLPALLLGACGNYDVTVNNRVVYTPAPLFTDFNIADTALRTCIREAIEDKLVTAASQLRAISCAGAGVTSLDGLATFSQIERLDLSSNSISDISVLGALTVLQALYLDHNRVVDAVPLYQLAALHTLDLSANPDLRCPASGSLVWVESLTLPRHCR